MAPSYIERDSAHLSRIRLYQKVINISSTSPGGAWTFSISHGGKGRGEQPISSGNSPQFLPGVLNRGGLPVWLLNRIWWLRQTKWNRSTRSTPGKTADHNLSLLKIRYIALHKPLSKVCVCLGAGEKAHLSFSFCKIHPSTYTWQHYMLVV